VYICVYLSCTGILPKRPILDREREVYTAGSPKTLRFCTIRFIQKSDTALLSRGINSHFMLNYGFTTVCLACEWCGIKSKLCANKKDMHTQSATKSSPKTLLCGNV